jgi:hypothetical protein
MIQTKSIENPILFSEIALLMSVDATESISWYTSRIKVFSFSYGKFALTGMTVPLKFLVV